jgi:hypothetical protein
MLKNISRANLRTSGFFRSQNGSSKFFTMGAVTATVILVALSTEDKKAENAGWFWSSPDYAKLKQEIWAKIDADEEARGDGTSMGPTLVRLAWHASGTYSTKDKTGNYNKFVIFYS